MPLSVSLSELVGFSCEAVLWGIYVVLFGISIILLFRRGEGRYLNLPVTATSCFLFSLCTTHFALEFAHYVGQMSEGDVLGYAIVTPSLIGANLLLSLADFVGDVILVYRCWVMWGRNWLVLILPAFTALAGFACIVEVAHTTITHSPEEPPPTWFVPLETAGYALPLCTNVMATALILLGIWRATHRGSRAGGDRLLPSTARASWGAMAMVIESGVLYLAAQLVFVVLIALNHPAQGVVAGMAVQIYGIAPTLIIIRVGLGVSVETTFEQNRPTPNTPWSSYPDPPPAIGIRRDVQLETFVESGSGRITLDSTDDNTGGKKSSSWYPS